MYLSLQSRLLSDTDLKAQLEIVSYRKQVSIKQCRLLALLPELLPHFEPLGQQVVKKVQRLMKKNHGQTSRTLFDQLLLCTRKLEGKVEELPLIDAAWCWVDKRHHWVQIMAEAEQLARCAKRELDRFRLSLSDGNVRYVERFSA